MTRKKLRILVTGFQPFPGAPYNPTGKLVQRLTQLRRPAFDGVDRLGHVFPVAYSAVDRQLPELIAAHQPDALLMFGLAARTSFIRIETRARNTVTQIWPDADHAQISHRGIAAHADPTRRFGPHTFKLFRAARQTGIDARLSLNAGYYLCNYLSWRAIEATGQTNGPRLAAFIHVPLVPRGTVAHQKGTSTHLTFDQLADAGESILLEFVRLTRRT
jgi:pyroglutamyl-peptidase